MSVINNDEHDEHEHVSMNMKVMANFYVSLVWPWPVYGQMLVEMLL